jgi:Uma2 family endonuclease
MANKSTITREPLPRLNGLTVRVLDTILAQELIRDRQQRGIDLYDEVWEGVYVMPPMPNLEHQDLNGDMYDVLSAVVKTEKRGRVQAGANVSDRRTDWDKSYRVPDIVVVLKGGRAVDCGTHWFGGPDFLAEVESPGDDTVLKIPFYSRIQVRELLIVHRDSRRLRLYRHDGLELVPVGLSSLRGKKWLVSEVLPVAFRRETGRGRARIRVRRTDGKPGRWVV